MFSALNTTTKTIDTDALDLFLDDTASESYELIIDITHDRHELYTLMTTINDLSSLHASIESHDLTPDLLVFANADNVLSNAIPGIPSLESMSTELTVEQREAALEGLADTIKSMIAVAISKIKALAVKTKLAIKLFFGSRNALREKMMQYVAYTKDKTCDDQILSTMRASLMKYSDLDEVLSFSAVVNKFSLALLKIDLPETREERVEWNKAMESTIAQNIGHYSFVHNGMVVVPKKMSGTFGAMSYTEASFDNIVAKLESFVADAAQYDDVVLQAMSDFDENVCNRLDELTHVSTSTSTSTTVDSNSNTVPTYTDGKTVTVTESAKILERAFDHTYQYVFDLNQIAWKKGAREGLRVLGLMTKAYK